MQLPQAWWSQLFLVVSSDGVQAAHIRMQSTPEEQGPLLSNLAEYLVAIDCGTLPPAAVRWRQVKSYKSIKTDVVNAGGRWIDRDVVTDSGIITSRNERRPPAH